MGFVIIIAMACDIGVFGNGGGEGGGSLGGVLGEGGAGGISLKGLWESFILGLCFLLAG